MNLISHLKCPNDQFFLHFFQSSSFLNEDMAGNCSLHITVQSLGCFKVQFIWLIQKLPLFTAVETTLLLLGCESM